MTRRSPTLGWLALSAAALVMATLGGAVLSQPSTTAEEERGGTLTIGLSAGNIPYPNTRPTEGYEGMRFVGIQLYDALTVFNLEQGDTVPVPGPGLAESWETSEDGLTWTFKLREGVTFHDGTPFNAEAVIFGLDRVIDQEFEYFDPNMYASTRNNTFRIASYEALDEFTVAITTEIPYAFLLWDLTHILFASPTTVQTYGVEDYVNNPVGTGPYKVVEYVDGEVLEMEPNLDYWRDPPLLDRLVLRPFPEPNSRLAALLSGDIDWAEVPPPDSLQQLEAQGLSILLKEYPHTIILAMNLYKEPINDVRVRQALQYAIDRENMCDALLNGVCVPAYQYLYEGHPWHDPEFGDTYARDLDKAKALLAEAGYPDGFDIRIAYPTGGSGNMWPGPMMELIQANFKEIGVNLELVPLEWNNIIAMYRQGFIAPENQSFDGLYISLAPMVPTGLANFYSGRIPPEGCCNNTGYTNEMVDELYEAAESEFDVDQQNAYLRQMMSQVAEDSPYLFVVHDLNLRVLSPDVEGFVQPRSWWADLRSVWVSE